MSVSDILLLLSCTVGLACKVRSMVMQHRAAARKRLDVHGERWGIRKGGLFADVDDDDEDEALWE